MTFEAELDKYFHPEFQRGRNPSCRVAIDWSNPLARGLKFAVCFTSENGVIDLIRGGKPSVDDGDNYTLRGYDLNGATNQLGYTGSDYNLDFDVLGTVAFDFRKDSTTANGFCKLWITDGNFQIWRNSDTSLYWQISGTAPVFSYSDDIFGNEGSHSRVIGSWDDPTNFRSLAVNQDYQTSSDAFNVSSASTDFYLLNQSSGSRQANGAVKYCYIWDRVLTEAEHLSINADPYQILKPEIPFGFIYGFSGGAFTLSADSGTYSYSGTDAELDAERNLSSDSGTYTYSGTDVSLDFGFILVADSGTYSYSGTDVALTFESPGNFTLSADSGSYSYNGTNAELDAGFILDASSGSYTYSGTDADLTRGFTLSADTGSYTYSGTAVAFGGDRILSADSGTYTVSGTSVVLNFSGQVWTVQDDSSNVWTIQ